MTLNTFFEYLSLVASPVSAPEIVRLQDITQSSFTVVYIQLRLSERVTYYQFEIEHLADRKVIMKQERHLALVIGSRNFVVTGLDSYVNYSVRVRAINHAGAGPWSAFYFTQTLCKFMYGAFLWYTECLKYFYFLSYQLYIKNTKTSNN